MLRAFKNQLKLMAMDPTDSFAELIPIVPISAINYGAGLSGISFRPFLSATFMGIPPRAFSCCFFGSSLLSTGSWHFKLAKEGVGEPKTISSHERRFLKKARDLSGRISGGNP
ncbi:MAG: VTT domain-containing protein [Elusimicrobia bacterium]|nr:VTT domain-containing protein [Elusimicrobiota bacterium]